MIDIKKAVGLLLILVQTSYSALASDTLSVQGIRKGKIKKLAKGSYKLSDYGSASYYYDQYLQRTHKKKYTYILADCYRKTRDYANAEKWYLQAFEESESSNLLALYYLAHMQKMNGKYKEALENFAKFKKRSSGQDDLKDRVKQLKYDMAGCDSANKMIAHPKKVVVQHMDSTINTIHSEASPLSLTDSLLVYSSLRSNKKEYMRLDKNESNYAVRKFYQAQKQNDEWHYKDEYPGPFNQEGFNTGNGALSPDGKRFYFTRCKPNKAGKMICTIFLSENDKGTWSEPTPLDPVINDPEFSSSQPTVGSESGKKSDVLYFVSDRPKGKGGSDIWFAIYDSKKKTFRAPKNAGSKVNSPMNEITPYYDQDKHVLFFSSEGWAGMGGYDIFQARGEMTRFSAPVNAGYPTNSGADDLYYAEGKNKEEAFFVSNRVGAVALKNPTCCDDLYSLKKLDYVRITFKGQVNELEDSIRVIPSRRATINIYVKDTLSPNPVYIKSVTTDDKGHYSVDVEVGEDYKIQVKKDDFFSVESEQSTKSYISSQTLNIPSQQLNPTPKAPLVLKNIYYAFGKADLLPAATAAIDTTILKVMKENEEIKAEISSHTDSKGGDQMNMTLSQKRAESVVNYLISKGIAKERLVPVGYGETKPIALNKNPDGSDNPEGMEKNRRTEFKIIGKIPLTEVEYKE